MILQKKVKKVQQVQIAKQINEIIIFQIFKCFFI